jgi:hypothetical protein
MKKQKYISGKVEKEKRSEFFFLPLFPNITSNGLCRKNDLKISPQLVDEMKMKKQKKNFIP